MAAPSLSTLAASPWGALVLTSLSWVALPAWAQGETDTASEPESPPAVLEPTEEAAPAVEPEAATAAPAEAQKSAPDTATKPLPAGEILRPEEPTSLEDELRPGEAVAEPAPVRLPVHGQSPGEIAPEGMALPAGDVKLRVPVQIPVPPHPGERPRLPAELSRTTRLLDLSTDLAQAVARDGGIAMRRSSLGLADQLVLRGGTGAYGSDLSVNLDGMPYGIPMAGRGINYVDLRLLPMAGIGSYAVSPGAFAGGYAGRVELESFRLNGVTGGVLVGEGGARRVSLAGGTQGGDSHAMLAFEARSARGLRPRTSDQRILMLGGAGVTVGKNVDLSATVHIYRDTWDVVGAVPATDPKSTAFDAGPTDGGELSGTGVGVRLGWRPSERTNLATVFGFLDDRFGLYAGGADQLEHRDHNRVVHAKFDVTHHLDLGRPLEVGGGIEFGYDAAFSRVFATEARTRIFQRDRLRGDWTQGGAHLHAAAELVQNLELSLGLGVEQLLVRRQEPRLGADAQTEQETIPIGALAITWHDPELLGALLRVARGHRTHPAAFVGGLNASELSTQPISWETETVDLAVFGDLGLENGWDLGWSLGGYGALYGGSFFEEHVTGEEVFVGGAELGLELAHAATGLTIAGRGGPLWSLAGYAGADRVGSALYRGSNRGLRAVGVPEYVAHVGILRPASKGFVAEIWIDAYGPYALNEKRAGGKKAESFQDVSARIGYGLGVVSMWLGVENLFDTDGATGTPTENTIARRVPRRIYTMLTLSP